VPYSVVKKGSKFAVVKKGTTKPLGTHPTRNAAERQIAAIHASESKRTTRKKGA